MPAATSASRTRNNPPTTSKTSAGTASLPPSLLSLQLPTSIPPLFAQSQQTLINHRKNHASLFKLHSQASKFTTETEKGIKLIGEKSFNDVFLDCLNRVLSVKKGASEADKVLKFVAGYVVYCQQQFSLLQKKFQLPRNPDESSDSSDEDEENGIGSTSNRFTSILLKHFLKGFGSKNKNVRLRCGMGIALCVNGLESLDDDLYQLLLSSLIQRSQDKEAIVRVQAVIALAKLQGGEIGENDDEEDDEDDEDEDEEGDEKRRKKSERILIDTLRFDPSSEARRASLFNLTPTPKTLPVILERLSDLDPINRRCVYLGSLTQIQSQANTLFKKELVELEEGRVQELDWDPKNWGLTYKQNEEILKIGLGERDESVKKACEKLLVGWFDGTGGDVEIFMARFDPLLTPTSSSTILSALLSLLSSRPQLIDSIQKIIDSPNFWSTLTPSSILLIRSLIDFSKKNDSNNDLADEILPPVTALAFKIKDEWLEISKTISLIENLKENSQYDEKEMEVLEKKLSEKEFIVRELLNLAMKLDYGDEIGRRKMFGLVRDMLDSSISPTENSNNSEESNVNPPSSSDRENSVKINVTPSNLIPFCLDVLLRLSAGQRDFMRVVVELVQGDEFADEEEELNQTLNGNEDEDEDEIEAELSGRISPKKKATSGLNVFEKNLVSQGRKLDIVRGMLERVGGALQENTFLHGLIPDLIAPAVRSKDPSLRESGIICLGLCCLLDNSLALDSMPLILDQISRASGTIKLRSTEILFDLVGIHGIAFLCGAPNHPGNVRISKEELEELLNQMREAKLKQSRLVRGLLGLMEDDDEELQAVAAQGIAKLMLTGALSSPYIETKKKSKKPKPSSAADRTIDENGEGDETINPNSNEEDEEEESEVEEDQPEDDEDAALYSLVLVYMSPETIGNQQLRQCLSYFLPAYCGSAKDNARRLQRVFLKILHILSEVYYEKDANQEMVTPLQVGLQLIEWTDPNKALNQNSADWSIHLDLAIDLVKSLFKSEEKEERKVFCQLLSKLSLPEPEEIEDRKPEVLIYLISRLSDVNPLSDSVSRNALARFETSISKRYPESATASKELDLSIEPSSEDPEEIKGLRNFLEKSCHLDLTGQTAPPAKPVEKSRPKPKPASKATSKKSSSKAKSSSSKSATKKKTGGRRRKDDSESEDESDDDDEEDEDDANSQAGTETGSNIETEDDEDELSETEEDFDDI